MKKKDGESMTIKVEYIVQEVPFTLTNSDYRDIKGARYKTPEEAIKRIEELIEFDLRTRDMNEYRIDMRYSYLPDSEVQ